MTSDTGSTGPAPAASPARVPPVFSALVGLLSLGVLTQAIIAGKFIDGRGTKHLIDAHGLIGDILQGLALITAIVAFFVVRRIQPALWWGSLLLLVLIAGQAAIGHAITDGGHDALITLHVPLAMLIFGVSVWLPVRSASARR